MRKVIAIILVVILLAPYGAVAATDNASKEAEIAALDKKIKELTAQKQEVAGQAAQTQATVEELKRQLEAAKLELQRTQLTIAQVEDEQVETGERIEELGGQITQQKERLSGLLRVLYEEEEQSLVRLFFDTFSLSQVLAQRELLENLQQQVTETSQEMRKQLEELSGHEEELEGKQENLVQLKAVLQAQEEEVLTQEEEQQGVLQAQKAEEAAYAAQLAEAKQAREEIQKQVFKLSSSNVEISLASANDMARFAGKVTGVRPALLMAVLKVESNLGNNVGGGRYPNDMQPASREAFVRLTDKLGLDRNTTPVSRKPASGWGGAMGPGQFMPATWEGIEGRIEQLMGKSPVNPYELSDAFVGAAIYLADRGAAAGNEAESLARYLAGPYWQYHVDGWYVKRVLAVAVEYEKELAE